jgi:hypothetical protein
MSTKFLAVAALAALLCAPFVAADSKSYVAPVASTNCAGGQSTGSACFKVPAGATRVAPSVTDTVFGDEAGAIAFVSAAGGSPSPAPFCPGDVIDIPAGTVRVIVEVTDPATSQTTCGVLAAGTTGTISVAWSSAPIA